MNFLQQVGHKIDELIGVFAPRWAAKRKAARYFMSYQAAMNSRLRSEWIIGPGGSADAELLPNLDTLRERSREEARNSALVAGLISSFVAHVVGPGYRFQSRIRADRLGLSPERARKLREDAERIWRKQESHLDLARRLDFTDLSQLAVRRTFEDGEIFLVRHYRERPYAPYGLCFEVVEADRVDTPPEEAGNPNIRRGIELDPETGEPVAYYIRKGHPGDYGLGDSTKALEFVRIPAFDPDDPLGIPRVIHLYWQKRPGQTRGEPHLTPALTTVYDLMRYREAVIVAMRVAACLSFFIIWDPSVADQFVNQTDEQGRPIFSLEPGMVQWLPPGASIEAVKPNQPSGNAEEFIEQLVREIGASVGLPYEIVMKDFSKTNYSSARAAINEAIKFFTMWQVWLVRHFCRPIWQALLYEAWARGDFKAPAFLENFDLYSEALWIPPGWRSVDPLKEAQAKILELRYGLRSHSHILSEQGLDFEEVAEQLAREKEYIAGLGLEFPLYMPSGRA